MVHQPPHQPTLMIDLLQLKDLFLHWMMPIVPGVPGQIGHASSRVAELAGRATVPRQGVVSVAVAVVVAVPDLRHHNAVEGQHPLAQQKHIHPTLPRRQSDVGHQAKRQCLAHLQLLHQKHQGHPRRVHPTDFFFASIENVTRLRSSLHRTTHLGTKLAKWYFQCTVDRPPQIHRCRQPSNDICGVSGAGRGDLYSL